MIKQKLVYICDVCKHEHTTIKNITLPVLVKCSQDDGKPCDKRIGFEKIDICESCLIKATKIEWGFRACEGFISENSMKCKKNGGITMKNLKKNFEDVLRKTINIILGRTADITLYSGNCVLKNGETAICIKNFSIHVLTRKRGMSTIFKIDVSKRHEVLNLYVKHLSSKEPLRLHDELLETGYSTEVPRWAIRELIPKHLNAFQVIY